MWGTARLSVAEAIIAVFRNRQALTVSELHRLLEHEHFPCSQRAVYKELHSLEGLGVIVRVKKHYALSLTWVLSVLQFSEQLYQGLVDKRLAASFLPSEGERRTWKFNDLRHLDRFWIQMIFLLFEQSQSRTMFVWVPYFWFDLIHYEKDLEAQQAMRLAGNKMYMILGNDQYLARLPMAYWAKDIYRWSYAKGPFDLQRNTYFDVIDDYILTVTLASETTAQIAELFAAVRSAEDMPLIRAFEQLQNAAPSKMLIENNPAKARRLRKQCCEYFGISAERFVLRPLNSCR